MAGRKAAQEAVMAIAESRGYDSENTLEEITDLRIKQKLENRLLNLIRLAGASVKSLAKEIYGSDARFVFELLQNADDNLFKRAKANGALPELSFSVHQDKIIIECNEDGFTEKDLESICAVGASSTSASHGYIGAKGIGFKSVFIAAWKVDIQSGAYSFYFKHEKGETGLGMITPIWYEPTDTLPEPLTRMTLHLHTEGDQEQLRFLRGTILKQLSDLQATSLLFLRKLRRISVTFHDEDGRPTTSKILNVGNPNGHIVTLETSNGVGEEISQSSKQYHVPRYMARNLPKSVGRDVPEGAEGVEGVAEHSQSEVILAFPLTSDSGRMRPLIEPQEVFAFLPIRESEFKFLIQADFDTSASRQDLLTTSQRNIKLVEAVASTFMKAVLQLCEHPDLCYTWPQFLPDPSGQFPPFWYNLTKGIKDLVQQTAMLKSRHREQLRKISDVTVLTESFADQDGNCLFDDSASDYFVSKAHPSASRVALEAYGLKATGPAQVINLLELDIKSPSSKMKSSSSTKEWHSKVSKLLTSFFILRDAHVIARLKSLPILPLRDGTWVSASNTAVRLPTTSGIPVPRGVTGFFIHPNAVFNDDRKVLFVHLGAKEESIPTIRALVAGALTHRSTSIEESRAHLVYLYSTHQYRVIGETLENTVLYTKWNSIVAPHKLDFYLPDRVDMPYGPEALLEQTASTPGCSVRFLHPNYLEATPTVPVADHPSWESWLHDVIGIRRKLRLVSASGTQICVTTRYVLEHRPEKFLGLLESLWPDEGPLVKSNPSLGEEFRQIDADAARLCHSHGQMHISLGETYLPLPELRRQCEQYMGSAAKFFPFLILDDTADESQILTKWMFLHSHLGVRKNDDIAFLMDILRVVAREHSGSIPDDLVPRIMELYAAMWAKSRAVSDGSDAAQALALSYFGDNPFNETPLVLVPATKEQPARWTVISECLWEAPSDMVSKTPLKHLYSALATGDQMLMLSRFFPDVLKVQSVNWEHLTNELETLKQTRVCSVKRTRTIYAYLAKMPIADKDGLRKAFEDSKLIMASKKGKSGWYMTSECVWFTTTEIQGKATINDSFKDLRSFFVDTLGVKTLTLKMVYDDLLRTSAVTTTEEIRAGLWSLNALLQDEKSHPDPASLLKKDLFPIRHANGAKGLIRAVFDFAIIDNESLAARFAGKLRVLDFSREEVLHLEPFLEWAGLKKRYLSLIAKETTAVNGSSGVMRKSSRDLRRKAHAILRIAAHFSSPRYQADAEGLYQLLRTATTMESDGIISVLNVYQCSKDIELETTPGDMHIEENPSTSSLSIFVPRDIDSQDVCYLESMPRKLSELLMRDPKTGRFQVKDLMITTLVKILSAPLGSVGSLLERQGIIEVSIKDEGVDVEEAEAQPSSGVTSTDDGDYDHDTPASGHLSSSNIALNDIAENAKGTTAISTLATKAEDKQYLHILNKVVSAARSTTFPSRGEISKSHLTDGLSSASSNKWEGSYSGLGTKSYFRSTDVEARDVKIGAAGELYVFEILSSHTPKLPGWGRNNWESNIRHYVTLHPDYADMAPWMGFETADLMYHDVDGHFTTWLCDHGYFEGETWKNARPKYFIEVKTTAGSNDTPFYMSESQYQHMKRVNEAPGHREVYMIIRVFGLQQRNIGMCVYMDPEALRQDGTLLFTAESWSVVPAVGKH